MYDPNKKTDTLLMISTCLSDNIWYRLVWVIVFDIGIILWSCVCNCLSSTALGLHCWTCFANTSWADCENKLEPRFCNDDPSWVCQTKVITTTKHGKTETEYSKECGLLSHCNAAFCNNEHYGVTERCQLECCCHDHCNTGVLIQGVLSEGIIQSLHGVCKILTIIMALYSTMTYVISSKNVLDWHFSFIG